MASAGKFWEVRSIRSTQKNVMTFLVISIFCSNAARNDTFLAQNPDDFFTHETSSILFSLTKLTYTECSEWNHANFNVAHVNL